ncbi:MAG: hypothetical protein K8R92_09825 [Planctomycetes bacterium]|nr:hypothetical protein [Planctomycetota bacterium]
MSDPNSSAAAHAETDAHRASICKAASCGPGCGPDCQCGSRLQKLETTTKRMLFCLWVALFIALMMLAFVVGRKVQGRRTMAPRNMMGQFDQRMRAQGGPMNRPMQNGQDGQMQGDPQGHGNNDGPRADQFRDNNRGPDGDKPMRQPRKRDGVPTPPPQPSAN